MNGYQLRPLIDFENKQILTVIQSNKLNSGLAWDHLLKRKGYETAIGVVNIQFFSDHAIINYHGRDASAEQLIRKAIISSSNQTIDDITENKKSKCFKYKYNEDLLPWVLKASLLMSEINNDPNNPIITGRLTGSEYLDLL